MTPRSARSNILGGETNNIISSQDQIENARFSLVNFKSQLIDLIEYFQELSMRIMERNLIDELYFDSNTTDQKIGTVKAGFESLESIIEGLAMGLTKQLNETDI